MLILKKIKAKKVYLPFYICNIVIKTIKNENIEVEFLNLNQSLEFSSLPNLKGNEFLLYVNYFGIKKEYCNKLAFGLKEKVIIDSTQAFFDDWEGICWGFNSFRKFLGVPDGSSLFTPDRVIKTEFLQENKILTMEHLSDKREYSKYCEYENSISNTPKLVSKETTSIIKNINLDDLRHVRNKNFIFLNKELKEFNMFKMCDKGINGPHSYPFLPSFNISHEELWEQNVFAPKLWRLSNDIKRFKWEIDFSNKMIPLPVDQRYGASLLQRVVDFIKQARNI